jgi:hypothetical protein
MVHCLIFFNIHGALLKNIQILDILHTNTCKL